MYKVQVYKYCIHIQYTYYDMYVYKTNNKNNTNNTLVPGYVK